MTIDRTTLPYFASGRYVYTKPEVTSSKALKMGFLICEISGGLEDPEVGAKLVVAALNQYTLNKENT